MRWEISKEEVLEVIWSLELDKAPGPDGFSIHFFLVCQSFVRRDLIKMLNWTRTKCKVGGRTSSSFLALIPKKSKAIDFSRFRPISLCNSSYKVLSKIFSNILKKILSKILLENEGSFMQRRQISDNIIMVQESLHSNKESNEHEMVIKFIWLTPLIG